MKQKLLIRIGLAIALLTSLAACNEEPEYATSILEQSKSKIDLVIGETYSLIVNAAETSDLTWASDKEDIVSVENGVLSANKQGKATITATNANNQTVLTAKVVVHCGSFKVFEREKLLFTIPLDSCIDFYEIYDDQTIIHQCVLYPRSIAMSDDSWHWDGEETGVYVEFGFRSEGEAHNGEYIAPKAGTYDIELNSWYFDYECYFAPGTPLKSSIWEDSWYDLYRSDNDDLTIKIEKKGNIYTVKKKGIDQNGYNFEFSYSGPMLNYAY